jgi:hypothetical protein
VTIGMARGRIALVALSAVVVGAGMLAVVRLAPTGSVATVPVAKPAEPRSADRAIGAVPGGVPKTPATAVVSKRFTGLHVTFPRTSHPVVYEIRGPQKPPVELLCGACPTDNPTHTSDARITLMEWNP